MRAVALLVIGLGIIMFVVGFKGSQHNILPIIKGTASSARSASGSAAPAKTATNTSTTTTTGKPGQLA